MPRSKVVGAGARLQTGIPVSYRSQTPTQTRGLLLRGVVIATYVTDDTKHPTALDLMNQPIAVYCDVLVYPSIPRQRWFVLERVLVSQDRGGVQSDNMWQPRATSQNLVTGVLNNTVGANPAQFDGDHVLVGFLNDSFSEPIILRGLPHPFRDRGNDLYPVGKRLRLKKVDGAPLFDKHNGVYSGVDGSGNHVVDSRWGNDGTVLPGGLEPPAGVPGASGNQLRELSDTATHEVVFYNMAAPATPVETARFKCSKTAFEILLTLLPCLKVEGSALTAKLTLGSGAVSATVAEHLESLWGLLKGWLDAHTHPSGTGPTGTPTPPLSPSWASNCKSGKLTFPDG